MDHKKFEELLLTVQKPGRYVGGEWNAVRKDWTPDKVKVLLAFPDTYEVGMSHLGMKILYGLLNARTDCLCERAFAPWKDFEAVMRENNIPLFGIESRNPMRSFDIVGFSLAYELSYTNVLNMLDLGGVPLRSAGRGDGDPIVIAGGPCSFNPEPLAEFIDAFVIGDGEEVVNELIDAFKGASGEGHGSRKRIMQALAAIPGIYVPAFYRVEYNEDSTIRTFGPDENGVPEKICKRMVQSLDDTFYPTGQIVPNIQVVHDRLVIEIMRGCKNACRFCQASVIYRPFRERSAHKVIELARASYSKTGYDEISLLSLSSGDYTGIVGLIEELNREFGPKAVSISVPSLRIEDLLKDLPRLIARVKKAGLTFAPEAGSDRLRKTLCKNIDIDKLFEATAESFKSGWQRVKLYFMIGLPTETEDEVIEIARIARRISDSRRSISGGRPARVGVSINAFVPKPHTPLQREAMDTVESLEKKRAILKESIARTKTVELDFHSFRMGYLEAAFARGDRKLCGVIYRAWKAGARFDGWQEMFDFSIWEQAFADSGIDPDWYVHRPRACEEVLPWDFIDISAQKT